MSQKVVVIGAVATGPRAASRLKRLQPDAEVTMVEKQKLFSYGGCGIPYYVADDVTDYKELQSTAYHDIRTSEFFEEAKDIRIMDQTEAIKIDRKAKTVLVKHVETGKETTLPYDQLVLTTGSTPRSLPIPGADLKGVFTVATLEDGIKIKEMVKEGINKAVVVGAGFIGLEMVESFADMWGIETTCVEIFDQVMPRVLSKEIAHMCQHHMEEKGITFHLQETVKEIKGDGKKVTSIVTDKREIEADLVIISAGVIPNSKLAVDAGLDVSPRGTIMVNRRMQTSDPCIYAGGDCVQVENLVAEAQFYLALGSIANRMGRVIGSNLAGKRDTFDGVVGSFIVRTFDMSFGGTGFTLESAKMFGYDAVRAQLVQTDRAHFMADRATMALELIVEKGTGRILGIQGACQAGDALKARIDAVAAILPYKPTVHDVSNLEIAYAPPFASGMDILNAIGNIAQNIIENRTQVIEAAAFKALFDDREKNGIVILDVRTPIEAEKACKRYGKCWINIPFREIRKRLNEIPTDKKILIVCTSGNRSFESQLVMNNAGINNSLVLQGGTGFLRLWGYDIDND